VPTISRFRGITISMFFREGVHASRPHFHARYAGSHATFDAVDLSRLAGSMPPRIERLVRRWAAAHRGELLENWERARCGENPKPIDPLK
jgi:hypothetical protein